MLRFLIDDECPHCKSNKGQIITGATSGECINCGETLISPPIGTGLNKRVENELRLKGYIHKSVILKKLGLDF